jgi:geranylgeranyl reductase
MFSNNKKMKQYDVVIVGAGPAGLRCADILSKTDLKVLLLEKDSIFGDKVCAGGLTRKSMEILHFPDDIVEHKITSTAVFSGKRKSQAIAPEPIIFTVKRKAFGNWQKGLLKNSNVEIRNNAKVTEIHPDKVIVNGSEELGFKFLVGADGYNSIVRKYLKLPVEKKLIGIQYTVPAPGLDPRLEIHLNKKYFGAWYGWVFPHEESIAVGAVCDPAMMTSRKLKDNFHRWLKEKGIDLKYAVYESAPISYDYRGFKFGNIFLVGEAGGFASGLTGEGIYQALVSGETAAKTILDEKYKPAALNAVSRYNAIQLKIIRFLSKSGIFLGPIQELIVMLLNNNSVKAKINKSFS